MNWSIFVSCPCNGSRHLYCSDSRVNIKGLDHRNWHACEALLARSQSHRRLGMTRRTKTSTRRGHRSIRSLEDSDYTFSCSMLNSSRLSLGNNEWPLATPKKKTKHDTWNHSQAFLSKKKNPQLVHFKVNAYQNSVCVHVYNSSKHR